MPESVILIGGGGHAKVIIDCIRSAGDCVAGILDDDLAVGREVLGVHVLGKPADAPNFPQHSFLIAIGNNSIRRKIAQAFDLRWYTAVHPAATVCVNAKLGEGSVVLPGAVINAGSCVGCHCIINTGAIVEHDNRIGDYVHISPRAVLGGDVQVGEQAHIGIGAVVRNQISVCPGVTVGAGAVVVKDITLPGIYVGVPARRAE